MLPAGAGIRFHPRIFKAAYASLNRLGLTLLLVLVKVLFGARFGMMLLKVTPDPHLVVADLHGAELALDNSLFDAVIRMNFDVLCNGHLVRNLNVADKLDRGDEVVLVLADEAPEEALANDPGPERFSHLVEDSGKRKSKWPEMRLKCCLEPS